MKQISVYTALVAGALLVAGCSQNDQMQTPCNPAALTTKAPQSEITTLKQYIDTSKIAATADARGFYYVIQSTGSGTKPTVCSTVTVNYDGRLTNGSRFDSANGSTFPLNNLITGWQEGIPLIAPGGSITLYLPPSLGYGAQAQSGIPANSILVFKIDLLRVN